MRAPLRSMSSFSSLLLEDCQGKLTAENTDYLDRIASSARRLDLLIRDVLSYAKLARGSFELVPVDLDTLVREIVLAYPCFHPEQAEIEIQGPLLPVIGNTALLTQSISNFLDNAVKFVPTGTRPRIRLWTEQINPGTVRLLVADNGIGIEPNHVGRIWKIFERLHHGQQYSGTGIGLSVVRRSLDRMNGSVGVESRPGQGSTFWFELPKATESHRGESAREQAPPCPHPAS
jgi:signal transduction histidine kinase